MLGKPRQIVEIKAGQVWKVLHDDEPVAHVLEVQRDGFVKVEFIRSRVEKLIRITRFDGKAGGLKLLRDEPTETERKLLAKPPPTKQWSQKIAPGTGMRSPRSSRRRSTREA